ncbi:hypothetical protein [Alienimonas californiensis]|uniref:hypothetical protein n=1 Tax=Alienimonas californiensis TaxID=2527989 RepID=UPI0011A07AE1|nr:hypothetical protein [Alienimonas californiensis]
MTTVWADAFDGSTPSANAAAGIQGRARRNHDRRGRDARSLTRADPTEPPPPQRAAEVEAESRGDAAPAAEV